MHLSFLLAPIYEPGRNDYLVVQGPATWPCLAYNHSTNPLNISEAINQTIQSPFLKYINIHIHHEKKISINFKNFLNKSEYKDQFVQAAEASVVSSVTTIQDRHPQQYFCILFEGLGNHTIDGPAFANVTHGRMSLDSTNPAYVTLRDEWFQCS
ncbi:hypothetical protein HK103_001632 [Boothiomyces macroporosus]|uniref:Uncharacterized protein n=1 Tax=Boothiomyces macroporosus TaxID=261099 RepID=A0AAD5UA59_9FUNG|nr:hypothetical protein HK103_001632 [Boothiomyces macroporosus]